MKKSKKLLEFVLRECEKDTTFKMTLLEALTDDCPYFEACGEAFFEQYGSDYHDGRDDLD